MHAFVEETSQGPAPLGYIKERKLTMAIEFSLNLFTEFAELNSVTKIFLIAVKGLEPATPYVQDYNNTKVPARHMSETGSLN